MSWQISAGTTTVTFPANPQNIVDENPIVETDFQVDTGVLDCQPDRCGAGGCLHLGHGFL